MDDKNSGFKIEKLNGSNYLAVKLEIELVLAIPELSEHLKNHPGPLNNDDLPVWTKNDAIEKSIIGLSLSDEHLEHVRDDHSAYDIWVDL